MTTAYKASVDLDGVDLAANAPIIWKISSGIQPSTSVFSVHKSNWPRLERKIGSPVTLSIRDARGKTIKVEKLTVLYAVPSAGPNLVSFLVADLRWQWSYPLIVRDYNIPKKTGDRTGFQETRPGTDQVTVDVYEYRRSSLNPAGQKWTAKEAVEDVLAQLLPGKDAYEIESWPIADGKEPAEAGQFAIQNVMIRDQGDVALGRLLALVPGASVYVSTSGKVVIFDGTDLKATQEHLQKKLPLATWDGEKSELVDRKAIRPSKVNVYYEREIEVLFEFADDYNDTVGTPGRNTPYVENVIPTVDPQTDLSYYDPETNSVVTRSILPPGTYVPVLEWLAAMDLQKPTGSIDWTFDAARKFWVAGDLDGIWGGRDFDISDYENVQMRIASFKEHFRQTFRISRRYTERIRDLRPVRVAVLDPVSGARSPAASWGQYCIIPSQKGKRIASRSDEEKAIIYRNVDLLANVAAGDSVVNYAPGPFRVSVLDKDIGVFRLDWIHNPYGTDGGFIPCNLVGDSGSFTSVSRDLSAQNSKPMGPGMRSETAANSIFLSRTMEMKACMTIVPAAPNNKKQFHKVTVEAQDIAEIFREEFSIQDGEGPELDIYIPPGEVTARFAWVDDDIASNTIGEVLGLGSEDPNEAGFEGEVLPGFQLVNGENEIAAHSKAAAAEAIAMFADAWQGRVATILPSDPGKPGTGSLRLVGNMTGATVTVGAAPSSKVAVVHEFPGLQRPINRMALLPESARHFILGVLDAGIKPHQ